VQQRAAERSPGVAWLRERVFQECGLLVAGGSCGGGYPFCVRESGKLSEGAVVDGDGARAAFSRGLQREPLSLWSGCGTGTLVLRAQHSARAALLLLCTAAAVFRTLSLTCTHGVKGRRFNKRTAVKRVSAFTTAPLLSPLFLSLSLAAHAVCTFQ